MGNHGFLEYTRESFKASGKDRLHDFKSLFQRYEDKKTDPAISAVHELRIPFVTVAVLGKYLLSL